MAKETLKVALAVAGAVALATPSWASGATSAVKKVGGPSVQNEALHFSPVSRPVRYHNVGAITTEFSSANRTGGRKLKSK